MNVDDLSRECEGRIRPYALAESVASVIGDEADIVDDDVDRAAEGMSTLFLHLMDRWAARPPGRRSQPKYIQLLDLAVNEAGFAPGYRPRRCIVDTDTSPQGRRRGQAPNGHADAEGAG